MIQKEKDAIITILYFVMIYPQFIFVETIKNVSIIEKLDDQNALLMIFI